ncbi:glutaredoxin domain-containing protein [Shewanella sp.]|jgi:glutaredoxin|uniref:glutaredoxin domain-containing protein n=1 Tax=Shewanella sp. TaxID=50422 RepID=UPI003D0D043A
MNTKLIKEFSLYFLILIAAIFSGYGVKQAYAWYNTPSKVFEQNTDAHFLGTDKKIVIYTTQWCPYCKQLRAYLNREKIAYEDRDIEIHNEKIDRLYASINKEAIPIIVLKGKVFIGFDEKLLDSELNELSPQN